MLRRFIGGRSWLRATRKLPQQGFRKILRTVPIGIQLVARCGYAALLAVAVFKHQPIPTHGSRTGPGALHARGLVRSCLFPGKVN